MNAENFYLTKYYDYEDDEYGVAKESYSLQELYQFAEAYYNYKLSERQTATKANRQPEAKALHIADVKQCIFVIKDKAGYYVKLFAKKKDAERDLKLLLKRHSYGSFYVAEEKLY